MATHNGPPSFDERATALLLVGLERSMLGDVLALRAGAGLWALGFGFQGFPRVPLLS